MVSGYALGADFDFIMTSRGRGCGGNRGIGRGLRRLRGGPSTRTGAALAPLPGHQHPVRVDGPPRSRRSPRPIPLLPPHPRPREVMMKSKSAPKAYPETIAIVGLGYIGLPTAVMLASRGTQVIGVDVNTATVARVARGELPFYEPGLAAALSGVVAQGRLTATTEMPEAAVYII